MFTKKIDLLLTLVLAVTVFVPAQKADAGVLLMTAGSIFFINESPDSDSAKQARAEGTTLIAIGAATALTGIALPIRALIYSRPLLGWTLGGAALLILDVDSSLPSDILEQGFASAYPFIDSPDSISDLVSAVKAQVPPKLILPRGQHLRLSVPETEVRKALSATDLQEEQIMKVVNDLK